MVRTSTVYEGEKRCELLHDSSGAKFKTDAPKDNHGKGESFSPTDLLGAALGSCALTTMAILGEKEGIQIKGAKAFVDKAMTGAPRKIASLTVTFQLPSQLTQEQRTRVEEIAKTCPVHRSLHPDVQIPMTFQYLDSIV